MADPFYNIPGNKILIVLDEKGQIIDLKIKDQTLGEFALAIPGFFGIITADPGKSMIQFAQSLQEEYIHPIDLFRTIEASRSISTEKKFELEQRLNDANVGPFDTIKVYRISIPASELAGTERSANIVVSISDGPPGKPAQLVTYYIDP